MHGLKTYFYHFKRFYKIFKTLSKDWKIIFEIIIKYHASLEFKKNLNAFLKSKFEWKKKIKTHYIFNIQLSRYNPKIIDNVRKFGVKGLKVKAYLGSRDWTITWAPKEDVEKLEWSQKTLEMAVGTVIRFSV